jgi:hypothetical protein
VWLDQDGLPHGIFGVRSWDVAPLLAHVGQAAVPHVVELAIEVRDLVGEQGAQRRWRFFTAGLCLEPDRNDGDEQKRQKKSGHGTTTSFK